MFLLHFCMRWKHSCNSHKAAHVHTWRTWRTYKSEGSPHRVGSPELGRSTSTTGKHLIRTEMWQMLSNTINTDVDFITFASRWTRRTFFATCQIHNSYMVCADSSCDLLFLPLISVWKTDTLDIQLQQGETKRIKCYKRPLWLKWTVTVTRRDKQRVHSGRASTYGRPFLP